MCMRTIRYWRPRLRPAPTPTGSRYQLATHFRYPFDVPIFDSHFRFPFSIPIFDTHWTRAAEGCPATSGDHVDGLMNAFELGWLISNWRWWMKVAGTILHLFSSWTVHFQSAPTEFPVIYSWFLLFRIDSWLDWFQRSKTHELDAIDSFSFFFGSVDWFILMGSLIIIIETKGRDKKKHFIGYLWID